MLILLWPAYLCAEQAHDKVKKSNERVCYEPGSSRYDKIKTFSSYDSMEECLASGGRRSPSGDAPGKAEATPPAEPSAPPMAQQL